MYHRQLRHPEVALAGDWEGNLPWAVERVEAVGASGVDCLLHLGDFRIWPGPVGKRYLLAVEKAAARHDLTILVTPGNHEEWPRLLGKRPRERDDLGPVWWMTDHIAVLPRGHRFTLVSPSGTERSVVSLGGAPSVNFEDLTRGRDWWPEEMMGLEDAAAAAAGGYADLMVTHDAPGAPYQTPAVASLRATNPQGWSDLGLAYAAAGCRRVTAAFEAIGPRTLVHGHFHVSDAATVTLPDGSPCRVMSLAADKMSGNIARLAVDELPTR